MPAFVPSRDSKESTSPGPASPSKSHTRPGGPVSSQRPASPPAAASRSSPEPATSSSVAQQRSAEKTPSLDIEAHSSRAPPPHQPGVLPGGEPQRPADLRRTDSSTPHRDAATREQDNESTHVLPPSSYRSSSTGPVLNSHNPKLVQKSAPCEAPVVVDFIPHSHDPQLMQKASSTSQQVPQEVEQPAVTPRRNIEFNVHAHVPQASANLRRRRRGRPTKLEAAREAARRRAAYPPPSTRYALRPRRADPAAP